MNKVYLCRGLPGSGKSTLAKALIQKYDHLGFSTAHFETDNYFIVNGEYKFDQRKLGRAHSWNQELFQCSIDNNTNVVVVSNTFTTKSELFPYVNYAHLRGYEVELVVPETPWAWSVEECVNKNTHGVPQDSIQKMYNRFQFDLTIQDILQ